MGRELVTSAANGDVESCRQILERDQINKANEANQELTEDSATASYAMAPRPAALGRNQTRLLTGDEILLTNFVSSGHTPLQAAAQNGHVNVCRMLIAEFNSDVEFQVPDHNLLTNTLFFSLDIS